MIKDYYSELEVKNSAGSIEICKAYKQLALKWHPSKFKEEEKKKDNLQKFTDINEAFEVLITPSLRAKYDELGYTAFKNGKISENGKYTPGYNFLGDSEKLFEDFFGTNNYHNALVQTTNEQERFLMGKEQPVRQPPTNVVVTKEVSLLDILKGKKLKIDYVRFIIEKNGISSSEEKVTKVIELLPGFDPEAVLVFKGEGNQLPGFENCKIIS